MTSIRYVHHPCTSGIARRTSTRSVCYSGIARRSVASQQEELGRASIGVKHLVQVTSTPGSYHVVLSPSLTNGVPMNAIGTAEMCRCRKGTARALQKNVQQCVSPSVGCVRTSLM